jgi:RHS repeat-associated protein
MANALNQYTNIVSTVEFIPEFDDDGNQTRVKTSTGIWHVAYNAENRPAVWSNGTAVVTMDFDRMGRRVWYASVSGGVTNAFSKFVYNGYLCVQKLDGTTGNIEQEFVWDPTETVATRPLKWTLPSQNRTFHYFHDGNKNVSDVVDADSAALAAHYDYAPFGAVTAATGPLADANPYRFSSEYHDAVLGCVYYNYRHYDPLDGRWMSRDPIEDGESRNNIAFCRNDSVDRYDIWGMSSTKAECEQYLKNALNYYYVRIHINTLNANQCPIPSVKCECCDSGGYYMPPYLVFWGNTIGLCYNKLASSQTRYNSVLEHEMFHAVQTCYNESEDNRCKTSVCKEIEAYYNANCFHAPTPELRKQCVKRGVDYSSASHCKKWFGLGPTDQTRINQYFEELYDKCKMRYRIPSKN